MYPFSVQRSTGARSTCSGRPLYRPNSARLGLARFWLGSFWLDSFWLVNKTSKKFGSAQLVKLASQNWLEQLVENAAWLVKFLTEPS
nr:unnamed protein product [Digitaria exilis]